MAKTVEKYRAKGAQVGISGSLRQRTRQTHAGETRSTMKITIRNLTMAGRGEGRKRRRRC